MIVQCPECQTKFNLDESRLPPEGAWVRCSNCQNVFQTTIDEAPPAQTAEPEEYDDLNPELMGGHDLLSEDDDSSELDADFGLDATLGGKEPEKPKGALGRLFKLLFWIVAVLILLGALAVGGLVAMDRLGMMPDVVSRFTAVPGLGSLLTGGGNAGGAAKKDMGKLLLDSPRGVFRVNKTAGRLFVLGGMVNNKGTGARSKVLVRGRLTDSKGKIVRQAVVYAGPTFTQEELKNLSMQEIQARLGQAGTEGGPYVVRPGGSIPFVIVFANLPDNVAEFTVEVVGSEPVAQKK